MNRVEGKTTLHERVEKLESEIENDRHKGPTIKNLRKAAVIMWIGVVSLAYLGAAFVESDYIAYSVVTFVLCIPLTVLASCCTEGGWFSNQNSQKEW